MVAISFGVLAEPVIGAGASMVSSVFVFAGSAQIASTAVLASGGTVTAALTAAILLNLRYVPMGIALAPSLRGGTLRRAAFGQAMIDASWAMASRGGGRFDPAFMVGATLPAYPAWIAGTAIGVFAGDLIGNPADLGLDVLFPAVFLALLVTGELRDGRAGGDRRPAGRRDRARAHPVRAGRRARDRRERRGPAGPAGTGSRNRGSRDRGGPRWLTSGFWSGC